MNTHEQQRVGGEAGWCGSDQMITMNQISGKQPGDQLIELIEAARDNESALNMEASRTKISETRK